MKIFGRILQTLAVILAVFILLSLSSGYYDSSKAVRLHLGCLSSEPNLNYSLNLTQRLHQLKQSGQESDLSERNQLVPFHPGFDQYVKDLPSIYEQFLKLSKEVRGTEATLPKSIKNAQLEMQQCVKDLDGFQEHKCQGTWKSLLSVKQEFEQVKSFMEDKFQQKKKLMMNLTDLIEKGFSKNQTQRLHTQIKAMQTENRKISSRIAQVYQFLQENNLQIQNVRNLLFESEKLLLECQENSKVITICNELSTEIKKIGLNQETKGLEKKIQVKTEIIEMLEQNLERSVDIQEHQQIKSLISKSKEELYILQQNYDFKTKRDLAFCQQCSQQVISLSHNISKFKTQIQALQNTTEDSESRIVSLETTLRNNTACIFQLKSQLQFQLNSFNESSLAEKEIDRLRSLLIKINGEIMSQQPRFQQIQHKMVTISNQMNAYVPKIHQVAFCISKKEYFEKIQASQNQRVAISKAKYQELSKMVTERMAHDL